MLYGNFKNTTFTQTTYNFNAGVGFFMALIMINFIPHAPLSRLVLVSNWNDFIFNTWIDIILYAI